jgi:hypothetical protein
MGLLDNCDNPRKYVEFGVETHGKFPRKILFIGSEIEQQAFATLRDLSSV